MLTVLRCVQWLRVLTMRSGEAHKAANDLGGDEGISGSAESEARGQILPFPREHLPRPQFVIKFEPDMEYAWLWACSLAKAHGVAGVSVKGFLLGATNAPESSAQLRDAGCNVEELQKKLKGEALHRAPDGIGHLEPSDSLRILFARAFVDGARGREAISFADFLTALAAAQSSEAADIPAVANRMDDSAKMDAVERKQLEALSGLATAISQISSDVLELRRVQDELGDTVENNHRSLEGNSRYLIQHLAGVRTRLGMQAQITEAYNPPPKTLTDEIIAAVKAEAQFVDKLRTHTEVQEKHLDELKHQNAALAEQIRSQSEAEAAPQTKPRRWRWFG